MSTFCPVCDTRFNPMEARALGEDGDTHLFHVRCRKCANSILTLVMVNHAGVSSVGLVTDMSFEDVMRLREARKVTSDDVLKTHEWLSGGDWGTRLGPVIVQPRTRSRRTVRATVKKRKSTGS